jgi:hypothetical protein
MLPSMLPFAVRQALAPRKSLGQLPDATTSGLLSGTRVHIQLTGQGAPATLGGLRLLLQLAGNGTWSASALPATAALLAAAGVPSSHVLCERSAAGGDYPWLAGHFDKSTGGVGKRSGEGVDRVGKASTGSKDGVEDMRDAIEHGGIGSQGGGKGKRHGIRSSGTGARAVMTARGATFVKVDCTSLTCISCQLDLISPDVLSIC